MTSRRGEAAVTPVARPKIVPKPKEVVAEKKGRPSDKARLKLRAVIGGNISPKSVASSGDGYVTAQNMMYRHSVTVYDARTLKLVKTISDAVRLARLGYPSTPGTCAARRSRRRSRRTAATPTSRTTRCTAPASGPRGATSCTPSSGNDRSFVYRIDMETLKIDRAYHVGAVPKVVAATPDDRFVLVATGARGI